MKYTFFLLLMTTLFLSSCSKNDLSSFDPLHNDIQTELPMENEPNLSQSLGLRNGTQKINAKQTDAKLVRGTEVRIPFFTDSRETVEVPTGTWITISFSLQDVLYEGPCVGPLTEEQVNFIMEDAATTVDELGIEVSFDGEEIDVISSLRGDNINIVNNNLGDCQFILPFRYYVNPQSKGEHTLSCIVNEIEYSRTISWVAGKKKGE